METAHISRKVMRTLLWIIGGTSWREVFVSVNFARLVISLQTTLSRRLVGYDFAGSLRKWSLFSTTWSHPWRESASLFQTYFYFYYFEYLLPPGSVSLALNRAELSELYHTQCETERVLSELQYVITKWAPRIDQVRTQQESKLDGTLAKFEEVARESAEEAISLQLQPLTMVRTTQPVVFHVFERLHPGRRCVCPWDDKRCGSLCVTVSRHRTGQSSS